MLILRLNKIGKNPHLVSDRETLESDWRQMNALLKALSVNTDPQSPNANAIEDNLRELVRLVLLVCLNSAQCPRCQLGIALNRARSDQSQIVDFVI